MGVVQNWCGYLTHIEGVCCSALSHKQGIWYFPRFLLRKESFTWMVVASFMVLVAPCASLSIMWSIPNPLDVLWTDCWWMGDGALRCSLNLSPKDLPDSSMYCSGQSVCEHLYWLISLLFWHMLSLSWGAMRRVHMVLFPLKCTCMPKLLQVFWNFSLSPLVYGTTMNTFCCWKQCCWCKRWIFSRSEPIFISVVKLLPVYNMASSGLWKMFTYII